MTGPRRPRVAISIFDDVGNPHYGGGGALVVARIAARLARDYDVTVYTGSYRGSGRSRLRDGVRYAFLPVGWAGPRGGQLLFSFLLPLVVLLRRPQAWLESLTPPFSASLLPVAARWVGCPVAGLVQMLAGADMQRRYKLPFVAIERRGLALYRHFVVLNETDGELVAAACPQASVTLIPNGVDRPADPPEPGGDGPVLFLGRIDVRQKGLDLLLAAADPRHELVVAGSGTAAEEARLRELAPPHARLPGRVVGAAKDAVLRECAFMVVPSRYETFCLSALEALSYGKPVVHFDLDRLGWIGPECGIAVPAFDVGALRAAIDRLAGDRGLRAAMGAAALRHSAGFGWDAVGARYAAMVAELLQRPGPGGRRRPGRGLRSDHRQDQPPGHRPERRWGRRLGLLDLGHRLGQRVEQLLGHRRSRPRRAISRSFAGSGRRATSDRRSSAAEATAVRAAGPSTRFGKICSRICSWVPLAKSILYCSFSPSRSSSVTSGAAKA